MKSLWVKYKIYLIMKISAGWNRQWQQGSQQIPSCICLLHFYSLISLSSPSAHKLKAVFNSPLDFNNFMVKGQIVILIFFKENAPSENSVANPRGLSPFVYKII